MVRYRQQASAPGQAEVDADYPADPLGRGQPAGVEVNLDHLIGGRVPVPLRLITEDREGQRLRRHARTLQRENVRWLLQQRSGRGLWGLARRPAALQQRTQGLRPAVLPGDVAVG